MSPENQRQSRGRGGKGGGGGRGGGPRRRSGGGGGGSRKPRGPIDPLHPSDEPPDIKSFKEWDLGDDVQGVIEAMGIETPTPIQRLAIQPVLDGKDVIAKAETGTGKTLAFGAPMMARIDPARASVLGLVLCPTRELAQQVAAVLEKLGEPKNITVALIVGGEPMHPQVNALKAGAQVVVGTPGRVLDLYGQGFLSFPWTEYVVLDEADEMLEIGFIDDVKKILSFTPEERQTLHFSATFPHDVLALARESTREPAEIATAAGVSTVDTIEQSYVDVRSDERPRALLQLIRKSEKDDVFLVFCDRRTEVDQLFRNLERSPFSVKALHGGYDQASRFRVMSAFRTGDVKALIATDVASRGLDVDHVTYVINYSVPKGIEGYTHRIGRTGRAGRSGRAITFVTSEKAREWADIERRAPWVIPNADEKRRAERSPDGGGRGGRGRGERSGGARGGREGGESTSAGREGGGRGRSGGGRGRGGRGRGDRSSAPPRDSGFGSGV
jgi:ATP-dependent RNA helicase DeaD